MTRIAREPMIEIIFRHLDHSDAAEKKIRDRIKKLSQFHGGILSCHVVVEELHRHQHQGNHFHVRVAVTVPGHELLTNHQPDQNKFFSDLYVAIREAFNAMDRKLIALGEHQRGQVKTHQPSGNFDW